MNVVNPRPTLSVDVSMKLCKFYTLAQLAFPFQLLDHKKETNITRKCHCLDVAYKINIFDAFFIIEFFSCWMPKTGYNFPNEIYKDQSL